VGPVTVIRPHRTIVAEVRPWCWPVVGPVIEMAAGMNRAMLVAAKLMARPPVLEGRAMPTGMA
jgi:hypothetical protein